MSALAAATTSASGDRQTDQRPVPPAGRRSAQAPAGRCTSRLHCSARSRIELQHQIARSAAIRSTGAGNRQQNIADSGKGGESQRLLPLSLSFPASPRYDLPDVTAKIRDPVDTAVTVVAGIGNGNRPWPARSSWDRSAVIVACRFIKIVADAPSRLSNLASPETSPSRSNEIPVRT